ncbi:hypothetical protein FALBO_6288 [Fusarium albosuccineum]|uniref:LysM domain-containing protein n=1 Tax=Fusarium albosuccineum TaxID=1237068 RepID=A0A8H4LET9_9HYPO|nr:hypothetical protein FALBO_6288 [Fusarium albosuccineum]
MMMESCSTCATILSSTPAYSKDEVSTAPSSLPQGLREPPAYSSIPSSSRTRAADISGAPPPYTPTSCSRATVPDADNEKAALATEQTKEDAPDILHFLDHHHDSVNSLSLRYGVPASVLRRVNNITSDHLVVGRRAILIPGEYYKGGVSLSPRPVEGEEEELRKARIRRFMTSCKVSDYDIAVLYLEQSGYDLETAVAAYLDDDEWERDHSAQLPGNGKRPDRHRNRGPFWRGL